MQQKSLAGNATDKVRHDSRLVAPIFISFDLNHRVIGYYC